MGWVGSAKRCRRNRGQGSVRRDDGGCDVAGRWRLCGDVPFEFVGEVARASALTEASHVKSSATARHDDDESGGRGVCGVE